MSRPCSVAGGTDEDPAARAAERGGLDIHPTVLRKIVEYATEYRMRFRGTGGPATAREATSVRSAQEPDWSEIRVKGHLADRWAASFDDMTLTRRPDGTTVLDGPVADQSALHGLLCKVSDFGLPLVPVVPTPASGRRAWPTCRTRSS